MKNKQLNIQDIKVGGIYKISEIVVLEEKTKVDIGWFQVGSQKCRITKISN